MTSQVDRSKVQPITDMRGEDDAETNELQAMLRAARDYMARFPWCAAIEEEHFGLGIGRVVGVFLFRIRPVGAIDEWLWVIVGDVPMAYLVTDRASSPTQALEVYCELMDDWIRAVRGSGDLHEAFPVSAMPTPANADSLEKRVEFLRKKVIPAFA
ncbi:hypothetical protein [Polyangium spumosum]|uniref:Uncharacterized protein n=1 Tax=Polyangium spumosum TaxID=889282 RepID=A0A6N7Q4Q5_9BACT|nr:hypothetical protein [Polyangium spumosum]MRG97254.1 hypothetical protein [Polyangium spumosum]